MTVRKINLDHAEGLTVSDLLDFACSVNAKLTVLVKCDYTEEGEPLADAVAPEVLVMGSAEDVARFVDVLREDEQLLADQHAREREAEARAERLTHVETLIAAGPRRHERTWWHTIRDGLRRGVRDGLNDL